MAWAACWTLLRSRPLQQLGEQGDVGRGPSPCLLFLLSIYRLPTVLLILSHLSSVHGTHSPCPPFSLCLGLLCSLR